MIAVYFFGFTDIIPRSLRFIAIFAAVFVPAIYQIRNKKILKLSDKAIFGEIFGIGFVVLYLSVMIVSQAGFSYGGLAFVDGIFGLLYGILLGVDKS